MAAMLEAARARLSYSVRGISVARLRVLFGHRRFQVVQALLVLVTLLHGIVEYAEESGELSGFLGGLQNLPVEMYVLPVVLAAYWYGLEGAIMTGLLATALSVPNLIFFHRAGYSWLGEAVANTAILLIGVVVGATVEGAVKAREEAEASNRRLRTLNDVAGVLNRHDEPHEIVLAVLNELTQAPAFLGVAFVPAGREIFDGVLVAEAGGAAQGLSAEVLANAADDLPEEPGHLYATSQVDGVPLGRLVASCESGELHNQDSVLLIHVARELAQSVEHARLRQRDRSGLQRYARAVTVAQEDERRRIARDLHDGPAQSLIVLSRGLGRLAEDELAEPARRNLARELRQVAQSTLDAVKTTTWSLRPAMLDDLGLLPAVQSLAERRAGNGSEVDFRVIGEARRLDGDVEIAAFRIAQEALSNIASHAAAGRASVLLEFGSDRIRVIVADDGAGFDLGSLDRSDAFGLVGMRERAKLVGGRLDIVSTIGAGTEVRFEVAVRPEDSTPAVPTA